MNDSRASFDDRRGDEDSLQRQPVATGNDELSSTLAADELNLAYSVSQQQWQMYRAWKRRQFFISFALFVATFLSTFVVGTDFVVLQLLPAYVSSDYRALAEREQAELADAEGREPADVDELFHEAALRGLRYAVPLMLILLCHEMGHYLQSVRYRVPASFPYFIPLPLPPLGTMGAVILQGRSVANRRQMFDIAVTGPIAGLIVTIPILFYGISTSGFAETGANLSSMDYGQPLLLKYMIHLLHGPAREGYVFLWNGYGLAGWVGVFITAMNLLPIGQLDGGHILYTLILRPAHWVAMGILGIGCALMVYTETYSYVALVLLLMLTGTRHPPTSNDRMPLGIVRHVIGWLTLSFLVIGFTPQPIIVQEQSAPSEQKKDRRIDPADVDPEDLVHVHGDRQRMPERDGGFFRIATNRRVRQASRRHTRRLPTVIAKAVCLRSACHTLQDHSDRRV